jgi:2-desacetyl-2-hydroxyethyl bacteriochlorophyllide A dehydrogenase
MQARAIVFPAKNEVEIQSHEVPALRPNEMLVRTEYSGISQGTEIWALTGFRNELTFPTIPGYQSVGIIEELGAEAAPFQVGQRVLFTSSRLPESCTRTWMGGHVSHAVVAVDGYHPPVLVPETTDPIAAAVAALPAVSLRGLNMLKIGIGDLVVVTGQGLIGQGSAQLARWRGATVIATDMAENRLRLSRENSADVVVHARDGDLDAVVRSIKPAGADAVIETTGRSDQFAPAIDLLREQGQLLLQGWYPNPITFDFNITHGKRPLIAVTSGFGIEDTTNCLQLMGQAVPGGTKLRYRELVTDLVPVDEAPAIYARLLKNDPDVLGVVFDWGVN